MIRLTSSVWPLRPSPRWGTAGSKGVHLGEGGWQAVQGVHAAPDAREDLEAQFAVLSVAGGPVAVLGQPWAWAFPLRSLDGHLGYLVASATGEPSSSEQFLLRVLAQQAGIAIAGARQRARASGPTPNGCGPRTPRWP